MKGNVSLTEKLLTGETIPCQKCREGTYIPLNPGAEVNHCFFCNRCDDKFHWDPYVEVT